MRRRVGDSEIVSYSMSHSLRVRRWSAIPCRTPWDTAAWHWTALARGAAAGRCALPFSADAIERLYAFVCVASRMLLFACFPRVALQVHGRLTYCSSATSTTDCTLLRISRATFTENLSSHLLDVLRVYCSQVPRHCCAPPLTARGGCACELLRHFTAARCPQRLLRCEPERDAR